MIPCEKSFGFVFRMNDEEKKEAALWYGELLAKALDQAVKGRYDLFILDEAMAACNSGMIKEDRLLDFLKHKPQSMEVVLTGRDPSEDMRAVADYISEIQAVRHPYEKGIGAREGIEY